MSAMSVLFASVAVLLLLAAPMERAGPQDAPPGEPRPSLRIQKILLRPPATGKTYRLGERLLVTVMFSHFVRATGTPTIELTIKSRVKQAHYIETYSDVWQQQYHILLESHREFTRQNVRMFLIFNYIVQAEDLDEDGISVAANALTLNGGTITLRSNANIVAELEHPAATADPARKVDGRTTDIIPIYSPSAGLQNPFQDGSPAWSHDGTKIASVSKLDCERMGIWVTNVDSSDSVSLTRCGDGKPISRSPQRSPDSTQIAFLSWPSGSPFSQGYNSPPTLPQVRAST